MIIIRVSNTYLESTLSISDDATKSVKESFVVKPLLKSLPLHFLHFIIKLKNECFIK